MTKKHNILVTGGTGFIGAQLVKRLVANGDNVRCLARQTSDVSQLEKLGCSIAYGDLFIDTVAVSQATLNVDTVYHLAASTHAIHARDMVRINSTMTENLFNACLAASGSPPKVVLVSSLAAVGPSSATRKHRETDARKPVSQYGRSKAGSEVLANKYSDRLPISIVRPPIVLGGGDRHGLDMFRLIDQWGWHIVPGFSNRFFSVIHVDDLAIALTEVAERGLRLCQESESQGIYFASSDETLSYAELGKFIGRAMGRKRTRILRVGKELMWLFAAFNEIKGRVTSRAQFLNLDKFREAFAGSWTCCNEKIRKEVGFAPSLPLLQRLRQTVESYRQRGWLKPAPPTELRQPSQQNVIPG